MSALVPVNAQIAGRSYRIRVAPEDEGFVRAALKRVNEQLAELRRTYAGKDEQDFVAMALLMYAVDKRGSNSVALIEDALDALNRKIDATLGAE